jgi:hypothetical protein
MRLDEIRSDAEADLKNLMARLEENMKNHVEQNQAEWKNPRAHTLSHEQCSHVVFEY